MGIRPVPIQPAQGSAQPATAGGAKSVQPPQPNQLFARGMSPIGIASQAVRLQAPMLGGQTRNIQPIQNGTGPLYARALSQL